MPEPLAVGDHAAYEHKGRRSFGIIREFMEGLFGEPRARMEWLNEGSPFPVPVEDLSQDVAGVVENTLKCRENMWHALEADPPRAP